MPLAWGDFTARQWDPTEEVSLPFSPKLSEGKSPLLATVDDTFAGSGLQCHDP
jgi:hypothetical protein